HSFRGVSPSWWEACGREEQLISQQPGSREAEIQGEPRTKHSPKDTLLVVRFLQVGVTSYLAPLSNNAVILRIHQHDHSATSTVVNQDGQPLIEGKLKEKQVRWKFMKRWKTRYFTLAGNQLLFQKGKSKDDPDDSPIELSKVQSVKAVAKKRRDRSLPRAFEIFTDNKTYVFKAKDEKNAEEWLQCINVAVAQAKERESREVTTYL
uniref:Protein melted homolog n=1 Tax=Castor canadensis TaxID=51338 RepID=A0A8B7TQL9_CASCN